MQLALPSQRGPLPSADAAMGEVDRWAATDATYTVLGVDEAGRGPLAGPVFAAAIFLPLECAQDPRLRGLDDSKRLRASDRERLYGALCELALPMGVAHASAAQIDELNILGATFWAMRAAVAACRAQLPEGHRPFVLVDGPLKIRGFDLAQQPLKKGDRRSWAIAAASILAKVSRDRHMQELHAQYPEYGFDQHKGYGTAAHLRALRAHGPCPAHRASFRGVLEPPPAAP